MRRAVDNQDGIRIVRWKDRSWVNRTDHVSEPMWETAVLATLPIFFETYKRIMGERKCHISSDPPPPPSHRDP
jgi:hypothetical protein